MVCCVLLRVEILLSGGNNRVHGFLRASRFNIGPMHNTFILRNAINILYRQYLGLVKC